MSALSAPDRSELLLTTEEVARLLRISTRTVRRLGASGQIQRIHIGTRTVRYTPDSVRDFILTPTSEGPAASGALTKEKRHDASPQHRS